MTDEEHFPTTFSLSITEIIGVVVLAGVYIFLRFFTSGNVLLLTVFGFLLAFWMIIRPTEWASEGLKMLAAKVGIGTYAAGVIGSLMANLPELFLAFFLIANVES